MSRILLADDSPHAQRMGERILRDEGYEVVSVTDGETALLRLSDVDPDLILADAFLPSKSGYEICRFVKSTPRYQHVRVVMTAGLLEPFDEKAAREAGGDAIIRKPFEASAMLETIRPLMDAAVSGRGIYDAHGRPAEPPSTPAPSGPAGGAAVPALAAEPPVAALAPIEPERVRAAVTLALDAAMPALVDEITQKVLIALGH